MAGHLFEKGFGRQTHASLESREIVEEIGRFRRISNNGKAAMLDNGPFNHKAVGITEILDRHAAGI